MTQFRTRKRDGQAFPVKKGYSSGTSNPHFVGVDKSQIEKHYVMGYNDLTAEEKQKFIEHFNLKTNEDLDRVTPKQETDFVNKLIAKRNGKYYNITPKSIQEEDMMRKSLTTPEYDLSPQHDTRKSFYGKARVRTENGKIILKSYNTDVAEIKDGKPVVHGTYSQTTLRHIKEFLKQHGHKAETSKQIMKDYKDSDKKVIQIK